MAFETVLGNEPVKDLLKKAVSAGRIGHAYLIEGPEGVGKKTLATAFAGLLLDSENPETHPDFMWVTNARFDPSKTQTQVLIDTVRGMKKDVYIRPYTAARKVYIMPNADSMQAEAQNSLLKVLEEPPEYCTLILLAQNANSFLQTVLSRVVHLRMQPLSHEQVTKSLLHQGMAKEKALQLASISEGCLGKALSLSGEEDKIRLREELFSHLFRLDGSYKEMYDLVRFLRKQKGEITFLLSQMLSWSRDLMHIKLGNKEHLRNADQKEALLAFGAKIPKAAAVGFCETTMRYGQMIEQKVNYPIAVHCMVMEYWEEIHDRDYRR